MGAFREIAVSFEIQGVRVEIAALMRDGEKPPLMCLHGFGSTKEDYADLALHPALAARGLVLLDAPGCGRSTCADPARVTIPFQRDVAAAVADRLGLDRFHLAGHSMGGLTALKWAEASPDRVLSLTSIEGNVAPEDCFLSRQILTHPADTADAFMEGFIERVTSRAEWGAHLYAAALAVKVRPEVVRPIFASMVEISDREPLLEIFCGLPCTKMFVHGAQNASLSYLSTLTAKGVQVAEIPASGHWPMYSNPQALWARLSGFLDEIETAETRGR